MNIDKRMVLAADQIETLQEFDREWAYLMDYTDQEWQDSRYLTVAERPRNVRRRYYRLLDKITGEHGMYGAHMICGGDCGEVYFEHRS